MARPRIEIPIEKIRAFCEKWKVVEFSLFGSVLRDDFRSDSDIDVLLSFEENSTWGLYDLVDMKDELQAIFGRKVDLVEKEAIRNPYRRRSMLTEQEVLYAA
jgi:predicted nucleotidyltransferase